MEHEWTEMMIDHQILGHHQFSAAGLKGLKKECLIPSLYCLDKPKSSNFLVRSWPPVHARFFAYVRLTSCRTSKLVTDSNDSKHLFPHYIPFHLQIVSPKIIIYQFPLEFSTFFPYITHHSLIFSYKPTTLTVLSPWPPGRRRLGWFRDLLFTGFTKNSWFLLTTKLL